MSRSRIICPRCRVPIGRLRKDGIPHLTRPVATMTTVTAQGEQVEYICPACGHRWTWERRVTVREDREAA